MTATQAVEAAAAGALGIDPFEMPAATARDLVSEHRLEHGQPRQGDDLNAAERIRDRALSILEARIDALSESPTAVDLVELQRIARATREVQKLALAVSPTDAPGRLEERSSSSEFVELVRREAAADMEDHDELEHGCDGGAV
jgi:hypothetical protein